MRCNWLNFQIFLPNLYDFLEESVPSADGIVADDDGFDIVERSPFNQSDIDRINGYLSSLNAETEALYISRVSRLFDRITEIKNNMTHKSYDDLSVIERKILLNISLTKEEELEILPI